MATHTPTQPPTNATNLPPLNIKLRQNKEGMNPK